MDKLIKNYEVKLVEPECAPGSARWGAQVVLEDDISAVFPYLNATLNDVWYDHENKVLIWGEPGQKYALRPNEIRVAQVHDPQNAQVMVSDVVERINRVWQERDTITPNYMERKLPTVLHILKLLPRTNCKQCGYPTCMAYCAELRKSRAKLEQCLPLSQPEYAQNREKIANLFSSE